MPTYNSILREYPEGEPKNIDEEDLVSGAANIPSPKKANGSSRLKGESFGYNRFSEGAPEQRNNSISGTFPSIDSPMGEEEQGSEVKRKSSNFSGRNKLASTEGGK